MAVSRAYFPLNHIFLHIRVVSDTENTHYICNFIYSFKWYEWHLIFSSPSPSYTTVIIKNTPFFKKCFWHHFSTTHPHIQPIILSSLSSTSTIFSRDYCTTPSSSSSRFSVRPVFMASYRIHPHTTHFQPRFFNPNHLYASLIHNFNLFV